MRMVESVVVKLELLGGESFARPLAWGYIFVARVPCERHLRLAVSRNVSQNVDGGVSSITRSLASSVIDYVS